LQRKQKNLFDTIFSDGFSQLQKCMVYDIKIPEFNSARTGSSSLRILNLEMIGTIDMERLRIICPQLIRFTTE